MSDEPRYCRKSDEEINVLAKRIYRNELFVSWMVRNPKDVPMVFVVLGFIDEAMAQCLADDDIQFFYEAYDQAGPGSINGYPIFLSAHELSREDGERLYVRVGEIAALMEAI